MPSFNSRASSTDNYPLQSLQQRTSLSSPISLMPRLSDEPIASGSGGLRAPKRSNSGHSHGKGKKRVSDEGMYEEEGLLSGLRGKGVDLDEEDVESVSQLPRTVNRS
jgi:hypothetical protein